jgi:HEAT repeat protein
MTHTGIFVWTLALVVSVGLPGRAQDDNRPTASSKTTDGWLQVLRNPDASAEAWQEARNALGPGGPRANEAVQALIDALGDPETPANARVAEALADHGSAVVPYLVRGLKRPEARVRAGAADTLRRVRPRPVDAVPALIVALADREAVVRREAAGALGRIRGPADTPVPALATALKDADPDVRMAAVGALGWFGTRAKPAVPALTAALKDRDAAVVDAAAEALGQVGPAAAAAVPALVQALGAGRSSYGRRQVIRALTGIGPGAKAAVPALIEALRHARDRPWAADALGAIGPEAAAAIPDLMKLADPKSNGCSEAVTALGRIGPAAKAAVPLLNEALAAREHSMTRAYAADALGGIGPDAKAAVPTLVAIARDLKASPLLRGAAARAVTKIDPRLAAREGMETAHLNVRAGKIPAVTPPPRGAPTAEQTKRARGLIAKLAETDGPDFGLSGGVSGRAFAPVPGHAGWGTGLLGGERPRTSDAFRTLVGMGPAALPSLLEALGDRTPTKLTVPDPTAPLTMMWLATDLPANPLNRAEAQALARPAADDDDDGDGLADSYRVKVGDVCFVAVGQIVGRAYQAARYQPTAMVAVTSPVESRAVRDRVRAAWGGPDPARRLFDSLLFDYATEGLFNGDSLDGWSEGSDFQVEAAVRLLYYFPRESAPLIAARLRSFDVKVTDRGDGWMKRDVKNGVRVIGFVKAVRWCKEPAIQEALADIAKRTDDPDIKGAVLAEPE